jgi:hypothetical protein
MDKQFENKLPMEVIKFFKDLLHYLKERDFSKTEMDLIINAENELYKYPNLPENCISISFRLNDVSYTAFYSDYKVEISDYISENTGHGYDHFQSNIFIYTPEETEDKGEIYTFIDQFMEAIKEIKTSEISVTDEE